MKTLKVGINGFGRIGRVLFRKGWDKINIKAINSPSPMEMAAHLLKYDSVHGVFNEDIKAHPKESYIQVNQKKIHYGTYVHPSEVPWKKWGVDLVLECSGVFKKREDLEAHLKSGAERVFVAAPVSNDDFTLIYGLNESSYESGNHKIISNGSCTTNCLAPMVKVLNNKFKIQEMMFTTVHSYTMDQKLLDSSHKKDLRRARAAALSMVPTSTGAVGALCRIFPEMRGKINGLAVRVPTANVSLVDMVFRPRIKANVEEVNQALLTASESGPLKDVLYCETQDLVSVDFNGSPYSCIIDLPSTMVLEGGLIKVLAWYDNETGFSQRMLDFIQYIQNK